MSADERRETPVEGKVAELFPTTVPVAATVDVVAAVDNADGAANGWR